MFGPVAVTCRTVNNWLSSPKFAYDESCDQSRMRSFKLNK